MRICQLKLRILYIHVRIVGGAMTINERFFKLLDEKKVSQKDFCEATGIPKQTVSGWKNRKTDPPASLIPTIAAYFGITSDFLLTGKECNQADLELNDTSTQQLLKYFSSLSEVEKNIVLGKAAEFYLKSLSEDC